MLINSRTVYTYDVIQARDSYSTWYWNGIRTVLLNKTIRGHKYYLSVWIKSSQAQQFCFDFDNHGTSAFSISGSDINKWMHYDLYLTADYGGYNYTYLGPYDVNAHPITVGTHTGYKNIMIIDLTETFGEGNEPATKQECRDIFNLPFYKENIFNF